MYATPNYCIPFFLPRAWLLSLSLPCTPDNLALVVDAAQWSCWDGVPRSTCNPASIATPRSSTSANMPASLKPFPTDTTTPWTTSAPACAKNAVRRLFARMASGQGHHRTKGLHLLLGDHLVDARHLLRDHNNANDDDPAFEASFFATKQPGRPLPLSYQDGWSCVLHSIGQAWLCPPSTLPRCRCRLLFSADFPKPNNTPAAPSPPLQSANCQ
ncbi:hypothetical protein BJV77DRAFT_106631 [Russula vinacea]|nr:hypothetical protein BJV77DRAFT_106631 [Russula vinacea]